MATQLFANNASSTLASGITNVATSLTLATGTEALFPNPTGGDWFLLTLTQATGPETSWEIVKCTARSTDTLTIVRAQEGTTAAAWATAKAEQRLTAAGLGPVVAAGVSGLMTGADKTKLDGITAGATAYSHPASHAASIITQDASNRFVTDAEKATWNAKQAALTVSATAGVASRVVQADVNGYILNTYFNSSDNSVASGVSAVMVKTGTDYYRSGTAAAVATFISGQTMNIAGSSGSCTGNAATATNAAGAFTVPGTLTVTSGTSTNIIMGDSDEGNRTIHCNSNRIGFLTQAGAWGSYCSDDGSWASDINITAAGTVTAGNYFYSSALGKGLCGMYDSSKYQGVFTMGNSWNLAADGSTVGNLYGLAWSHPNAGGAAANLDSHGLLCLINGGFASSMSYSIKASGNVTALSDERLKTNWRNLAADFVSQLATVKVGIYDRIDGLQMTQVGVSAQSLREVMPEAVIEAADEFKTLSVAYGNAALAACVALAKEVQALKEEIKALRERL